MKSVLPVIMKNLLLFFAFVSATALTSPVQAQNYASYSKKISVKGYEGLPFRVQCYIKIKKDDDSSVAYLFARVTQGDRELFFKSLGGNLIQNPEWKLYTLEGTVEKGGDSLAFGPVGRFNGKYYFDDLTLDVQTPSGSWKNVYAADFENGVNPLKHGSQFLDRGINKKFTAEVQKGQAAHGNGYLLLEGKNIIHYGKNKSAGKYADVNGVKLYYEIYGEGVPLVVLTGSIDQASAHYPYFTDKHYKVIAIDSRGQGNSGDTDADLTFEQMASDVNVLLELLKIDSAYVLGGSEGAITGLILAKDHPEKVKKLVFSNGNTQHDSLAIFNWIIAYESKMALNDPDVRMRKLYKLMSGAPNIPYAELAKIKAPVLVIAGDREDVRPEHSVKIFQSIPNSQLCIIPGAASNAPFTKLALFLEILSDFFDKPFSMPSTMDFIK